MKGKGAEKGCIRATRRCGGGPVAMADIADNPESGW